jgi:hypothetical protein
MAICFVIWALNVRMGKPLALRAVGRKKKEPLLLRFPGGENHRTGRNKNPGLSTYFVIAARASQSRVRPAENLDSKAEKSESPPRSTLLDARRAGKVRSLDGFFYFSAAIFAPCFSLRTRFKTCWERGTVPIYSEDCANLGQSPQVL